MVNMEMDKNETFWTDEKVIEFCNQFIDLCNFAVRYKIRDSKLIEKFKADGLIVKQQKTYYSKSRIKQCILDYFHIDDILTSRVRKQCIYKQIYVYFLKEESDLTYLEISDEVGYKRITLKQKNENYKPKILGDNSSIFNCLKTVQNRIDTEPKFKEDIENIRKLIKNEV